MDEDLIRYDEQKMKKDQDDEPLMQQDSDEDDQYETRKKYKGWRSTVIYWTFQAIHPLD